MSQSEPYEFKIKTTESQCLFYRDIQSLSDALGLPLTVVEVKCFNLEILQESLL